MESYKIFASIALHNGVSPVLSVIGRDMLGLNNAITAAQNNFGKLAIAVGGVAAVMGGTAILGGLAKIAQHGTELLDQQDKLIRAGLSHAEVANLTADAYERIAKAVPTATASDVLRTVNELRMVTGSVAEAQKVAPKALMMEALIANSTGKSASGQGYDVWRALEMKGIAMDEKKTDEVMGKLTDVISAYGGKVSGSEIKNFAQMAGPAWQLLNEHAMTGSMPYMINEMHGERAGTGWNRMYNTLMGTRRWTRQQYNAWKQLGLIDQSKVLGGDQGGMLNFAVGGPIKGAMENIGDMEDIITKVIKPALDARGVKDPATINAMLAKMFPDSTASRFASRIYQQIENIEKDRVNTSQTKPLTRAYGSYITENPKGVREAFDKQYESMMSAIGAPMMQAALPVMQSVTEIFTAIGKFANANPMAVKIAAEALAILGGSLVVGGLVALSAAVGGLIGVTGGIAAAVAALGALALLNWDAIKNGATSLWESMKHTAQMIFDPLAATITAIFQKIASAIQSALSWIPGIGSKQGTISGPEKGYLEKQSYKGESATPGFLQKINWQPPAKTAQPQSISMSLNIDGRTLATTIGNIIAEMTQFPTGAPYFDGRTAWNDPGNAQIVTG